MTQKKQKPSAKPPIFSGVSDFFGSADKGLDQVKKSINADLADLKKRGPENLATNIYLSAEEGFKKDLEELGIKGDAQTPYLELFSETWRGQEMGKKSSEILNSPELKAMDAFIAKTENLPKVQELMKSAKPQAKWESMLSGIMDSFPEMKKYMKSLGPILTSLGLGFLVKKKNTDKKEKNKEAEKKGKETEKEKGKEKIASAKEVPSDYKSKKKICIVGDSNVWGVSESTKEKMGINCVRTKTKGAMQASWFLGKMGVKVPKPGEEVSETGDVSFARKGEVNKEFLKDVDTISIGFGSNDIGEPKLSAKDIWNRLLLITRALKKLKPGIRIYLATIPAGDNPNWNRNLGGHDKADTKRKELNGYIIEASKKGLVHQVMRLDKKQNEGGVADNNDPSKLHPDYLTYSNKASKARSKPIDRVHLNPKFYAHQIRIAQYRDDQKTKNA